MSEPDAEIERLKASVSCAALLERRPPGWQLDHAQSTRRNLKYRRGAGEIVIVNHDGRGWWDPLSDRKGDIFSLVQHLEPGLSFAAACRVLRDFAGNAPVRSEAARARRMAPTTVVPIAERWEGTKPLSRRSPTWRYLTGQRGLPARILAAASAVDAIRGGPYASAWFAHRHGTGRLTGFEMRGPDWRGFSAGGEKTLFRLPGGRGRLSRVAVCEAAIDALSLAAIEQLRRDTLYVATAGGMGPATVAALRQIVQDLSVEPSGVLIAATDADTAGRCHAARLQEIATAAGVPFDAILPPDGRNDWNDVLRAASVGS